MAKHTPYMTCAECGAALDPGERCECAANDKDTLQKRSVADGGKKAFDKEKNKEFVEALYNRHYGRRR